MSHLVPLRQKIKSVQATKKITHAVRLVSMSLYNKLDKLNVPLQSYTMHLKKLFSELIITTPEWKNSILFPGDVFDTSPLFVVVATTKGLCGSLNSNLFRYIESSLFIEKQQTPRFIAIGQRAIKYLQARDLGEIVATYNELTSSNFITIADDLVAKITAEERYSSVVFFSSEAKSFFVQRAKKFTLIPVPLDFDVAEKKHDSEALPESDDKQSRSEGEGFTIWEQNPEIILDHIAITFLRSSIIASLFQALRAEHAARFIAMENSTNNADQYLERLTLQFNKLRQALITKEVSELSATFTERY